MAEGKGGAWGATKRRQFARALRRRYRVGRADFQTMSPAATSPQSFYERILMARILLASELGANLGHVGQLLPLASELRVRGHEVIFAVRDVPRIGPLLRRLDFRCVQAPFWQRRGRPDMAPPCSYSEILQHYGYRDAKVLLGLLTAWRQLYALIEPKVVICEFAPTALLACRGLNIARVQFGFGFSVPPKVKPLPSFRSWEAVPRGRLEASDATVLDTANAALRHLGAKPLESALDLFDAEAEFLCTFRELDHYRRRSEARYSGPMYVVNEGGAAAWPHSGRQRVFVYMRPSSSAFERTAQALTELGYDVLWVASGVSSEVRQRYEGPRFVFSRVPVRLDEVSMLADAAVLQGGHGTVAAMLLEGIPLMLFPEHAEQGIVARNVSDIGAGIIAAGIGSDRAHEMLSALVQRSVYKTAAQTFADGYKGFEPASAAAEIADELTRVALGYRA
jgi:UDP:flavonoid glycosyltransferase YjiC (YdhE family)